MKDHKLEDVANEHNKKVFFFFLSEIPLFPGMPI